MGGHGRAEQEPARFETGNGVEFARGHRQGLFKCFEQNLQALGVGEHWHEITEDDAFLGNPGTERTKDTRYSASCCPTLLNASMVMSDCAIVLAPFMPLRCDTRMVLPNRTAYFVLVSLSSPVSSAVSSSDTTDASIGT